MREQAISDKPIVSTRFFDLLVGLLSGLLTGSVTVIASVSLAALIFAGDLSGHLAEGIRIALVTAVVIGTIVSLRGSCGVAIAIPQDRTAPILAIMAANIAAAAPAGASADQIFAATFAAIVATTVVTGLFLLGLGVFRAGFLMRFMPYSVLAGFFAGTGWLLLLGGLRVATGLDLAGVADVGRLADSELAPRSLAGLAVALSILTASRFVSYAIALPSVLLLSTAVMFAAALGNGVTVEQLMDNGWLLGVLERDAAATLDLGLTAVLAGDTWAVAATQWASLGTILLVSAVSILLTASALELLTGADIDVNRELRVAGLANLAAGLGGGMVGFHSLSISSLVIRLGGANRAIGVFAALTCAVALYVGTEAIGYLPRMVLGGLLLFMGLSFLGRWLFATWGKLPWNEYLVIPLILLVIAGVGFIEGVLVGLLAALILFVLNYSRTSIIRHELSGAQIRSTVERNLDDERFLRGKGDQIHILKLRGYLFFGTATRLASRIQERAKAPGDPLLRFVLLDFSEVSGIDSSASYAFHRMRNAAGRTDFTIVLTGMTPKLESQLHLAEFQANDLHIQTFANLDYGLEWCENRLLEAVRRDRPRTAPSVLERLAAVFPDGASRRDFLGYFTEQSFDQGETLIEQGDAAGDVLFLEEGEVSVYLQSPAGERMRIRRTGRGTVLGEIGFYLGSPRSASVIAERPGKAYRLEARSLKKMEAQRPDLAAALHRFMADLLAERLLHTTRTLESVLK